MGFCNTCNKSYPGIAFCPEHGVQLLQVAPRPQSEGRPQNSAPTQLAVSEPALAATAAAALPGGTPPPSSSPNLAAKPSNPNLAPITPGHDPWIGQEMGNFRLTKLIGTGGMGAVYLAEHKLLPKRAAVKLLKREFALLPEVADRFRREAESAVKIAHENIVQILDFGQRDDGTFYLTMELLEGQSLSSLLKQRGALTADRVYEVLRPICLGLAAAHDQGIVHRDLKPDNIFLSQQSTPEGRVREVVKVLDFGIAKINKGLSADAGMQTGTGMILGTPYYMSPEQAEGGKIDHRSDIYSLGVILYEMFVGRVPFTADTFGKILFKHIGEAPVPLRQLRPDLKIPAAIEAMVMKCLAKDPAARPSDARALLALFEGASGLQAGSSSAELPLVTVTPIRPAASRSGLWVGISAAAALVLSVGAYSLFAKTPGKKTPPAPPVAVGTPPSPNPPTPEGDPAPRVVKLFASPGAQVYNQQETTLLGSTPYDVTLPEEGALALVLKAEGFAPYPLQLRASEIAGDSLQVQLMPAPAEVGSPNAPPSKGEGKKDPGKKDPGKKDPIETDPKTDPPKVDPPKVDPPKTDPPKVDPPKTDPPKTDGKKDPPKIEEGSLVDPFGRKK